MPTVTIREIDNTTSEEVQYDDHVVLVPGKGVANSTFTKNNKAVLYEDLATFNAAVSYTDSTTTTTTTTYPTDSLGYQMTIRLLALGLKVLYVPYDVTNTDSGFDFTPYEDKAKYNIRYIVLGDGYTDTTKIDEKSVVVFNAQNAIKSAATRGDAIALIDIPVASQDTSSLLTWINNLKVDDISRAADTYDGTVTKENAFKYATSFAPTFNYKNSGLDKIILPGSLGYLSAFAAHKDKFPDWFAFAGATRGVLPFTGVTTTYEYGDSEIAQLQKRTVTEAENKAGGFKAINTISEIRPYGHIIWGNRTLFPITLDADNTSGLKASSFLNIRNLCCDIKKTLYRASRQFTFEPDSDTLWFNFTSAITPLLEQMKTGQGIKGYKLIKQKTKQKATLKVKIKIIPIEAVEDFDLTVELTDSVVTVTE